MTGATADLVLLALAVVGLLLAFTLLGAAMRARLTDGAPDPVVETFVARVRSWWAIVFLLGVALLIGLTGVVVLFAFASFAALREFLTYTYKRRADHLPLALAFFAVLPLQYLFVGLGAEGLFGTFVPVYVFLLLPVVTALRGDTGGFLVRIAETQWGLMITVYCLSHVPALMTLPFDADAGRGALLIVFFVLVVQIGDLAEYYAGRLLRGRRIAPGLSPKTWAGALIGVIAAAITGGALSWIAPFPLPVSVVLAAAASAVGQCGAIVLSAIKRDRGVRDWSHLIPGQGGFMDQLDSVIFAAPVFYHLAGFASG